MKVLKFGGTSVGSPENIKKVKAILESQEAGCAVVVSAFGGVTDQIIATAGMASKRDPKFKEVLISLRERHVEAVNALIEGEKLDFTMKEVDALLSEFEDI